MAEHLGSEAKDVSNLYALIKMYDYYNASKQLNKVSHWLNGKSRCEGKASGCLLASTVLVLATKKPPQYRIQMFFESCHNPP